VRELHGLDAFLLLLCHPGSFFLTTPSSGYILVDMPLVTGTLGGESPDVRGFQKAF
jgi:hypothetical protein